MSDSPEKKPVGVEQPLVLKKISFGVVCAFCGLIALMIFDSDNYKTWFSVPMILVVVSYYYFMGLNVSNVYKYGGRILVEHAVEGEFIYEKDELLAVKSALLFNKLCFADRTFYIFHSAGFMKALFLAGEKNYEQDIMRDLRS
ncbi:hypothetical protein [Hymenobacter siberiensis]|jgi:hypothetical protein|uniref:hypothetical protein n=1 Tax=Hymenobacter siberiensis TaxID=2848396 RepID=UPI001C1E4B76|nr:hypothetical protein [Hymenobacter siberiensis]MBU6123083.1 hypothetical protein [Hymenobacter siberiensis]